MNLKKSIKILWIGFSIILIVKCTATSIIERIPLSNQAMVKNVLQKADKNRSELIAFLNDCNDEEISGAAFLLSYMPE